MRRAAWTALLLLPALMYALGRYLGTLEPPCPGGFIDGPCDEDYDPWGLWFWLIWAGAVLLVIEVLGLLARAVRRKRRSSRDAA